MSTNKKVTLGILFLLILTDVFEAFIQFCFKKSTTGQTDFAVTDYLSFTKFIWDVAHSPFLWIGFLSVATLFVLWSTILSKIDLSVAVPVASFSYVFVPLVSIFILHEKISLLRWAGIGFILLGVVFVSLTSSESEKEIEKVRPPCN